MAAAPFNSDYGTFKNAIIGQESGGRYGVANTEGSGAMGVGQVMPATAQTLAARQGLPYRPDLMAGKGPDAQAYQNAITEAAAREAWQAGQGDPKSAAMYYFGGSNRSMWGPKTRAYGQNIVSRMGGQ
jgi:soluble lytic murein transglycosylase-like protein